MELMSKKYRMSSAQKRLFTIDETVGENILYNIPALFYINGTIDLEGLEKAFQKLCNRHEILRTYFMHTNDTFVQVVEEEVTAHISYCKMSEKNIEDEVQRHIKPFKLETVPLMRMKVIEDQNNKNLYLFMDIHHIICDGESMEIIWDELRKLYNEERLEPLSVQYKNYSAWEYRRNINDQKQYWINEFSGNIPPLELRTDYIRPGWRSNAGDNFEITVNKEIKEKIETICAKTKTTEYMFLLSVFMFLLKKYTDQNEIIVGTPMSGRTHPATQHLIGMFVNTVAIKGEFIGKNTFIEFLYSIKNKCLEAYDDQDYPFDEMVQDLNIQRDYARNPIFNVMFGLQEGSSSEIKLNGVSLTSMKLKNTSSKFDITLMVDSNDNGYTLYWEYDTELFVEETIREMADHYTELLINTLVDINQQLNKINYISESEKNVILNKIAVGTYLETEDKKIIDIFEECVEQFSDNVAVQYKNEKIKYTDLNRKANYIANKLIECGVTSNSIVGIIADTSIERICSIFGVLKTGAAYLPIDVFVPQERLNYIINNSCLDHIIIDDTVDYEFKDNIVRIPLSTLTGESSKGPIHDGSGEAPAYIIYTSGSSGNPKGVMVSNKNIVNEVMWHINDACLNNESVYVQATAFIFDGSVLEIFSTLLSGAKLLLINSDDKKEPEKLLKCLNHAHISLLPSMFRAIVDYAVANNQESELNSFTRLNLVAEKIPEDLILNYIETEGSELSNIWNFYGPTETTVTAASYRLNKYMDMKNIPIGKPVSNYKIYILNDSELCAKGIKGEICIGGKGVSLGYVNNKELTSKVFVQNPFCLDETIYRTGDIGYINYNEEIVIVGRLDDQVKIRGYRVELQEIERQITNIEEILEAKVVRKNYNGKDFLAAYYFSHAQIEEGFIKEQLARYLPSYMIPEFIIQLDEMPLLPNGKVDKKYLEGLEIKHDVIFESPNNKIEEDVCTIFSRVLGYEKISINDSFFELGGDSIKAIRVVSGLRELGYYITVKKIMQISTVKLIAKDIEKINEKYEEISEIEGEVPFTPIQERFFSTNLYNPNHFNQSVVLVCKDTISQEGIEYVLNKLVNHHDQLRVIFEDNKQMIGKKEENKYFSIINFELASNERQSIQEKIAAIGNKIQSTINITQGPLINCGIVNSDDFHGIIVCIHHLIVDGVSWEIIIEDINQLYEGYLNDQKIELTAKSSSFKAWSEALNSYYNFDYHSKELSYWKKIQSKIEAIPEMDLTGQKSIDKILKERVLVIGKDITNKLLTGAKNLYDMNVNEILVTALVRIMHTISGSTALAIYMESHGRAEFRKKLSVDRTVGWFTDFYPIYMEGIGNDIDIDLRNTKENIRRIPNYGIGYDVARKFNLLGDKVSEPIITFNYFGVRQEDNSDKRYFSLSELNSGETVDKKNLFGTPIAINCEVINEQLQINISFNNSIIPTELIERLLIGYSEEIEAVVNHCVNKKNRELTLSDYGEYEWTDLDWNYLLDVFHERNEEVKSIYPLTSMQQGMLFHKIEDSTSLNYVLQTVLSIKQDLSLQIIKKTLKQLSNKHEILKTRIFYKKVTSPRQAIPKIREMELNYYDLSVEKEQLKRAQIIIENDKQRGFNIEEDCLFRLSILKIDENNYKVIMTAHHIIMDGWSLPILVDDFMELYELNKNGKFTETVLEKQGIFSEYVSMILKKDGNLNYWYNILSGLEEKTTIRVSGNPDSKNNEIGNCQLDLDENITFKLTELTKKYQVTTNTIIETIWGLLLSRYNNSHDVIFGKVVSGRNADIPNIEKMVGLFINTIPVRIKIDEKQKISSLLKAIQDQALKSGECDHISLMDIQNKTKLGRDMIQTIIAFENYFVDNRSENAKYTVEESSEQTNFDLALSIGGENTLMLNLMYRMDKYNKNEIENILTHFKNLTNDLIENPEKEINQLSVINEKERNIILHEFNNYIEVNDSYSVAEHFEKVVREYPNNIAVECEEDKMTYKELNDRANYIASILIQKDVKSDEIIALVTSRSCDMLVGIYGILKAGGAYLPIDPNQPIERIKYMLEDSNVKCMLIDNSAKKFTSYFDDFNIYNISENKGVLTESPLVRSKDSDLCYVIYTSGTTGKPKGVLIEQGNLKNLVIWLQQHLKLDENSIMLQDFSFIFDGSVWEIFSATLSGSKLLIVSDKQRLEPKSILPLLKNADLIIIPTMYRELLNYAKKNNLLNQIHALKSLTLGAESVPKDLIDEIIITSKTSRNIPRLINAYGPTETTVCSTFYEFTPGQVNKSYVGKPIRNVNVYIMQGGQLAGIGMIGELFIGGLGVARGYLNNEELTMKKFVDNPFKPGEILYQTGDLGRWNEDGNIELLGRIGEQVKIRGFRIELGEIETAIRQYKGINDATVIFKKTESVEQIIGYIVADCKIDIYDLKDQLYMYLNEYMVPDNIIQIAFIPKTLNGKIDRSALPIPEFDKKQITVLPNTKEEKDIYNAFLEVLDIKEFSIDDNFFDIGGNSIKAIGVITYLQNKGYDITVRNMMRYRTIRLIANNLSKQNSTRVNQIEEEFKKEDLQPKEIDSLLHEGAEVKTQADFELLAKHSRDNFNSEIIQSYTVTKLQSFYLLTAEGIIKEKFHVTIEGSCEILKRAVSEIINEQSVLRSSCTKINGNIIISEHKYSNNWVVPYIDRTQLMEGSDTLTLYCEVCNIKNYSWEVNNPLSYILLIQLTEKSYEIVVIADHCIWDKASSSIFKERLEEKLSNQNDQIDNYLFTNYIYKVKHYCKLYGNKFEEEIVQFLRQMVYQSKEYNRENKLISSRNQIINLSPIVYDLYNSNPWVVIENIIKTVVKCNRLNYTDDKKYPVFIVQDDRNYMKDDMSQMIGECLDLLPANVDKDIENDLKVSVEKLQNLKRLKGINYSEMLFDDSGDIYELFNSNLIVNFQGMYEITEEAAQKWIQEQDNNFCSTEVFINNFGDKLVISYPIFDSCEDGIGVEISEELLKLEKSTTQIFNL